jgi:Uma2 family endonuclease
MGTTTLMSFAEFEQLPTEAGQIELLKGELIQLPAAQRSRTETSETLFESLRAWRKSSSTCAVGKVHMEMGYRMSTDPTSWLQPDVSVTHPNQPGHRFYENAPLVAFEVVSEFDMARQLQSKVRTYLEHGAKEVWLLYPEEREAWVYREYNHPSRETEAIRSDLLPGFSISLAELLAQR